MSRAMDPQASWTFPIATRIVHAIDQRTVGNNYIKLNSVPFHPSSPPPPRQHRTVNMDPERQRGISSSIYHVMTILPPPALPSPPLSGIMTVCRTSQPAGSRKWWSPSLLGARYHIPYVLFTLTMAFFLRFHRFLTHLSILLSFFFWQYLFLITKFLHLF